MYYHKRILTAEQRKKSKYQVIVNLGRKRPGMKSSIRLPRNYRRTMRGYLVKASWQRRKSGIFKGKSSFMNSKISYWNSKLLRMKSSRRDLKNRYGNRKRKSWLIGFKNYRM